MTIGTTGADIRLRGKGLSSLLRDLRLAPLNGSYVTVDTVTVRLPPSIRKRGVPPNRAV